MTRSPVIMSWSGGKDSSYALHELLKDPRCEVKYLLSTFNGNYRRLSMHGVREELIEAQASSIGIPLIKVYVYDASNTEYEQRMSEILLKVKAEGIGTIAFGDIFLQDLRRYREDQMNSIGMKCMFPIWKKDTKWLANDFIEKGFRTVTCCVNDGILDEKWCGRIIDSTFLAELPPGVDHCGENGEFHSFCYNAPIFTKPINVRIGEKIYRTMHINADDHPATNIDPVNRGFWFSDLLLQPSY
jgi:uncharacterized protein (TIGR00290 family)